MRFVLTVAAVLAPAIVPAAARVMKPVEIDTGEVSCVLANGVESRPLKLRAVRAYVARELRAFKLR